MDTRQRIAQIDNFWEREFAYYLNEHRASGNRATHFVGIPILLGTAAWAAVALDWRIFVAGQGVGWAIQVVGHRIEGNRPAFLKRPVSFMMGPLMVLVELAGTFGLRFGFAERAREALVTHPA